MCRKLLLLLLVCGLVSAANAASYTVCGSTWVNVNIVEADHEETVGGNTTASDGSADWSAYPLVNTWGDSNQWKYVTDSTIAPGSTHVWQNGTTTAKAVNTPEMITTITVPELTGPNFYEVFVAYKINTSTVSWTIAARMDGAPQSSIVIYDDGMLGQAGQAFGPVGQVRSAIAKIGEVNSGTTLGIRWGNLDKDGNLPSTASTARVMAIGIGYREVPEPATVALLGLGSLALIRRKRH